jgi:fumarylacetoacetase
VGPTDTWIEIPDGSPFPVDNLPFGVFSRDDEGPRVGVAIGDHVLDLAPLLGDPAFLEPSLNAFMAQGRPAWRRVRSRLTDLLTGAGHRPSVEPHLVPAAGTRLHRPVEVGDYIDFYSSRHHAENVGRIFRPDGDPLPSNWLHLPIGYHGRSGTVVASGTPVIRPSGQRREPGEPSPTFGPSVRLDFEAEVGFVVGTPSSLGHPVPISDFAEHVFGVVLVNDWSARDLQSWEYVPLGPFLGKSFATSMSSWVVTLDALEGARVPSPVQEPPPLPYLAGAERWGLDLSLEVSLNGEVISRPPFAGMYWTPAQQLAHLTVNGASLRTGDLYASGTVSGALPEQVGSLIELTSNGRQPLTLAGGATRGFLQDGDTVAITATAPSPGGGRLGFGEVTGTIRPAVPAD